MRFSILFFLFFLLSFGQQSERQADSLKSILKNSTISDKERIKILNKLTQYYGEFDFKQAKSLNNQIYTLSKKNSYYNGLGFYYQNLADNKMYTSDFKAAEQFAKKAQIHFLKAKDINNYLLAISSNCFALDFQGKYKLAQQLALDKVKIFYNRLNNDNIVELYYYLSTIYDYNKQPKTALFYLNKALSIYAKKNNYDGILKCKYQMASICIINNMNEKALLYLDQCNELVQSKFKHVLEYYFHLNNSYVLIYLNLKNYNKALQYSKIVKKYIQKGNLLKFSNRNNLAFVEIYIGLKQYKKAQEYISILEKSKDKSELEEYLFNDLKSQRYFKLKEYDKALFYTQKNYTNNPNDEQNIKLLTEIHFDLKNFKQAYYFQKQYITLKEAQFELDRNNQIAEYEALFQIKEKDIELKNKNLQVYNKEIQIQSQNSYILFYFFVIVALIIVFLLLAYSYHIKKKSIRITKQKNEALALINDLLTESNLEKEILLKEIHHRVKNNLQLVMSLLNIQAQDSQNIYIADFLEKSQSRIATMSLIHQNLYLSDNFARIDFQEYLENLVENIRNTFNENNVVIAIDTHGNSFDLDIAIPLGLIVNEIVCNAFKHAFPENMEGKIQIAIQKKESNLFELVIGDNGIGTTAAKKTNSIGLELVSLLVMQLRGKIEIINQLGTHYSIQFRPSIEC